MSEDHNKSMSSDAANAKDEQQNMGKQSDNETNKKRKLDADGSNSSNGSGNKRSSKDDYHGDGGGGGDLSSEVYFKLLVPSSAAGGVIGRGGERIGQIQKDAAVRIKMSKANEYYPNTNERICLVTGTVKSVLKAHALILERILEKPEMSSESERVNQIKFLIPNSTAGLLIGKGGAYIKQIKDDSGAFVQISSKTTDLPERIVTIDGEAEKRNKALQIIVKKISEDPQHNSVTTLNYSSLMNHQNSGGGGSGSNSGAQGMSSGGGMGMSGPNSMVGNSGQGNYMQDQYGISANSNMNPGDMSMGAQNSSNKFDFNSAAYYLAGLNNLALLIINCGGSFQMTAETLRGALRNAGYSSPASNEIIDAITVLMSYGLITKISPAALLAANPSLASLINLGPAGLANITTALAASMIGNMGGAGGGGGGGGGGGSASSMNFSSNSNMPQHQSSAHHHHHHQQQQQPPSVHHHHHQSSNYHQFYPNTNGSVSGGGGGGSSNGLHHLGKVNKK